LRAYDVVVENLEKWPANSNLGTSDSRLASSPATPQVAIALKVSPSFD
jgi:hypothetical protein